MGFEGEGRKRLRVPLGAPCERIEVCAIGVISAIYHRWLQLHGGVCFVGERVWQGKSQPEAGFSLVVVGALRVLLTKLEARRF